MRRPSSRPPGRRARSPANPDTLVVPLKKLAQGWYLVWWRVISADGHPVRGAFTFAVGPNPGPAPQFVIPSISETAATPRLIVARWLTFLFVMSAIGLFVLRLAIARPVVRLVSGTSLRKVSIAFVLACALGLVMTPVYLLLSTAQFALRSWYDLGALVPLIRDSSFGRGYVDLELTFALFTLRVSSRSGSTGPNASVARVVEATSERRRANQRHRRLPASQAERMSV